MNLAMRLVNTFVIVFSLSTVRANCIGGDGAPPANMLLADLTKANLTVNLFGGLFGESNGLNAGDGRTPSVGLE